MLILTRKSNESIIIGEGENQIIVTLLETSINQSRIAIKTQKKTPIRCEEIPKRIKVVF